MSKDNIRWYDADKYLSIFMKILEDLPRDIQIEVANDIILNMPSVVNENLDIYLNLLHSQAPNVYRRWYDKDLTLHSAIECLKNLSDEQRNEILNLVSDIVFSNTNQNMYELLEKYEDNEDD